MFKYFKKKFFDHKRETIKSVSSNDIDRQDQKSEGTNSAFDMDQLHELNHLPQHCPGAPSPHVLCNESKLFLVYLMPASSLGQEHVAVISFDYRAHRFGGPNDEALSGHPLYARGLRHYSTYEVVQSSWIKELEIMNSVHPYHRSERFRECHHYVFTFHDSMFECIATNYDYEVVQSQKFHLHEVVAMIAARLNKSI